MTFIALVACDNDDIKSNEPNSYYKLVGDWIAYDDESENSISCMSLGQLDNEGSNFTLTTYNKKVIPNDSWTIYEGSWKLNNNWFRINYSDSQNIHSRDFEIMETDDVSMVVYNLYFHCIESYHKVVGSYVMFNGYQQETDCLPSDFYAASFKSLNENVATVDLNGRITATGVGSTYIIASASNNDTEVAVKVNVKNSVKEHASEVNMNIDDIIEKYKDQEGYLVDYDNDFKAIVYFTPSSEPYVNEIQFHYEPQSKAITSIEAIYKTPNDNFTHDVNYIDDNYKEITWFNSFIQTCESTMILKTTNTFEENKYSIIKLNNGVRYLSVNYYLTHGNFKGKNAISSTKLVHN